MSKICICEKFIYVAALMGVATFSFSSTLIAQDLNVGLLVPTAGFNKSLGEQVRAGAEFGISSVNENYERKIKIKFLEDWDGKNVKVGLDELEELGVDAIIVDLGPSATKKFIELANSRKISPAILLSYDYLFSLYTKNTSIENTSILQFGRSDEWLFSSSLKSWGQKYTDLKSVIVVYDEGDSSTLKLGVSTAIETLNSLPNRNVSVSGIPFNSKEKLYYKDKIEEVVAKKPDGIVLAAKYGDRENFIRGFIENQQTRDVPIILSGPIDFSATDFISEYDEASVHYGDVFGDIFWSEFLANEHNDSNKKNLANRMIKFSKSVTDKLGWYRQSFSFDAVAAYNAIQILAKAQHGPDGQNVNDIWQQDNPWRFVKNGEVPGLTGTLRFSDDLNSMIPPSHLVVIENKKLNVLELD